MAADIFIKFTDIKGESKNKGHEKEIDLRSWSWGLSQTTSMGMGGGGGAGKVHVQNLNITKYVDAASTALMLVCCNGKHISEAILTCQKAGGTPLPYIKITLTNVFICSYNTAGAHGEDYFSEQISLCFEKVKVEYDTQDDKGAKGDHYQMGWDVAANTKL